MAAFPAPAQSTVLIAAFGLIVQGSAVWKLRHAIRPFRLVPFLIGAVIGVPLGGQFAVRHRRRARRL